MPFFANKLASFMRCKRGHCELVFSREREVAQKKIRPINYIEAHFRLLVFIKLLKIFHPKNAGF